MIGVRLPGVTQRTTIIGRTGSGKTRFGTWLLSMSPFDQLPYIIIDHKREGLFENIERIRFLDYNSKLPKEPGLYLLQPDMTDEAHDDLMEQWLLKVWNAERKGLYIDELYSIRATSRAMRALYTQGRSKKIPMISLTQRPSQVPRFAFSEADFFAFFQLSLEDDRKTAQSYAPKKRINLDITMPEYHSYWYDVSKDIVTRFSPVPDDLEILDAIDRKLAPKRKVI